jgi:hypothetical protein
MINGILLGYSLFFIFFFFVIFFFITFLFILLNVRKPFFLFFLFLVKVLLNLLNVLLIKGSREHSLLVDEQLPQISSKPDPVADYIVFSLVLFDPLHVDLF